MNMLRKYIILPRYCMYINLRNINKLGFIVIVEFYYKKLVIVRVKSYERI